MGWKKQILFAFALGVTPLMTQSASADDWSHMFGGGQPAQDLTGTWELGAQLGGLLMDNQSELEPHMLSGGRVGYYLTNEWEMEVNVLAGPITDRGQPDDGVADEDGTVLIPTVEALYYGCTEGPLRPFVSAGVGAVVYDDTRSDDGHVAMNVGGGAKWFITDQAALRFDGRWLLNTKGGAELNEATLTGGLSWHFNPRM